MPFDSHFINVSIFPHVLSGLDDVTKTRYKERYRQFKSTVVTGSMTALSLKEGTELAKDVLNQELKAYAYKGFFGVMIGPILQLVAIPFYVYTQGLKARKVALIIRDLGAYITRSEMIVMNWGSLIPDFILFGQPVPIHNNETAVLLKNETLGELMNRIDEIGSKSD